MNFTEGTAINGSNLSPEIRDHGRRIGTYWAALILKDLCVRGLNWANAHLDPRDQVKLQIPSRPQPRKRTRRKTP